MSRLLCSGFCSALKMTEGKGERNYDYYEYKDILFSSLASIKLHNGLGGASPLFVEGGISEL